ncbi:MAG: ArsA family ATPase [Proteobacteria bacterium]|nr:ArsA family ATPase [Pseudomonadota bacterium]
MHQQLQFFIGKGGVGKSTTSAITSVLFSHHSLDTLLVSLDPAHNQSDIFQVNFSEKPQKIANNLTVIEVDTEYWIKKYLKETQQSIKRTYRYASAFNIDNYFDVLQFSPGLEEYALLQAFENIIHTFSDKDMIVFDMAPTALTLRFFCMPFITLIWLEALLKLRSEIYEKKEIISRIKIGQKEIEQDKIKVRLEKMICDHENLRDLFRSGATSINLVMNNDKLSFSEAVRIKKKLADIGIRIDRVVVNKIKDAQIAAEIENEFKNEKIVLFPFSAKGLLGYPALNDFIDANRESISDF